LDQFDSVIGDLERLITDETVSSRIRQQLKEIYDLWKHDWQPVRIRVARWFIFKPKIPIWVKSGGPWSGKC
jgi:hypothetical protein